MDGWTPLHAALFANRADSAQILLSSGANINAQDSIGITPVMAFVLKTQAVMSAAWKLILEHGFDVTVTDKVSQKLMLVCQI